MPPPSREEEFEEELEWEERKDSVPMHMHMLAGSCAGVTEHLLMFPIDTFKVSPLALSPAAPLSWLPLSPTAPSLSPPPPCTAPVDAPSECAGRRLHALSGVPAVEWLPAPVAGLRRCAGGLRALPCSLL